MGIVGFLALDVAPLILRDIGCMVMVGIKPTLR
jgi:hypothetical protein